VRLNRPLVLAARASDLARLQATVVGAALQEIDPELQIEYRFKTSQGDQNPDEPLWQSQSKGLFTQDFYEDLLSGATDVVVHSWKDLPVEPRDGTLVAATLPREDVRDVLLIPKRVVARKPSALNVLTSSPRRQLAAQKFLRRSLPWAVQRLEFKAVRGNVATRVQKLLHGDGEALFVAKAALDRLLSPPTAEFESVARNIRQMLDECDFQVWPLSQSPSAAAQGALGLEVANKNTRALHYLQKLNHRPTFESVEKERQILQSFGGGCHQKLGMTCLMRDFGEVVFVRGQTEDGRDFHRMDLTTTGTWSKAESASAVFPSRSERVNLFEREDLPEAAVRADLARAPKNWWVARESAVPGYLKPTDAGFLWTAGTKTWMALAQRGFWVHGTADGLGERELPGMDRLAGAPVEWTKLTHRAGGLGGDFFRATLATYQLRPKPSPGLDFISKTHFFWMSGSQFDRALQLDPTLKKRGFHASGPGLTATHVRKHLESPLPLKVFLNYEQFITATL
jgi:hydroxymethylbilane synthase